MFILVDSVVVFGLALALTPVCRHLAIRFGAVDIPNERSSHEIPTPRGGGVAILIALGIGIALRSPGLSFDLIAVLVGAALIAFVGLVDDFRSVPIPIRLGLQLTLAAGVALSGNLATDLAAPLLTWSTGGVIALGLTVFWVVALTNAYNFMDGINGLAALQAIVSGAAIAYLLFRNGDWQGGVVGAMVAAAAAGFLPWNYPKARIFMGDVGSGGLGFLLGFLAVRVSQVGGSLLEGALPLLPFLLDTGYTLARRIVRRDRWWQAHRTHLYQRMVRGGYSHTFVTALWGALAVGSGVAAVIVRRLSLVGGWLVLAGLLILHAGVAVWIMASESGQSGRREAGLPPG